jgi:hypothetical protein
MNPVVDLPAGQAGFAAAFVAQKRNREVNNLRKTDE